MAVALVVGSERQLRLGTPWCQRIAAQLSCDTHIVIAGEDRKVLQAQAKKITSAGFDQEAGEVSTAMLADDANDVLNWAREVKLSLLLMIHSTDTSELQRSIFEQSHVTTLWIRTSTDPPESAGHLYQAVRNPIPLASLAFERLFGLIPEHVMLPAGDDGEQLRKAVIGEIECAQLNADDLVIFGIVSAHRSDPTYSAGLALIDSNESVPIALIREGESITQSLGARIHRWASTVAPMMQREQRLALATSLEEGTKPNLEFLGLMSAASMLAAFGLLQDSAAVIIGAMLIAPLMTPILGAGLALAQGNRPLFRSALLTITTGFLGAITSSMLFGWLVFLFQEPELTPEMWARCRPSPLDFCVGMVGGMAAAYARTRSHLSSALAGAAIAAALVPPISTAGLQIAFGRWGAYDQGVAVTGPLLLVTVNVLTIMIGSSFILWARGMRADKNHPSRDRWGPRMMMLLMILAAAVMTRVIGAERIFPLGI